jgi:hypothetical protein
MESNNLKFIAILLQSLWLLTGCATVTGRKQILSVDSEPRGAKVYLKGEQTAIGTTPFFYKTDRVPSDTLIFQPEVGAPHSVEFRCQYRFWLETLGNGSLALLSPEAAILAFSLDYVTGAAFDCPAIKTKIPNAGVTPYRATYCRKYLIVPPFHFDEKISDEIAILWMNEAQRGLKGCDDFIEFDEGKSLFQRMNITNRRKITPEDFRRTQMNYIGLMTGMTDVVVLDYEQKGTILTISPRVLDAHNWQQREVGDFKVVVKDAERFEIKGNDRYFLYTFRFIPNSATYGFSKTSQLILPAEKREVKSIVNEKNLPSYLSNWNMVSVEHPDGFEVWDVGFDFYPSFSYIYKKQKLSIQNTNDGSTESKDHTLIHVLPTYNASVSLHTAIGAFTLSSGVGFSQHYLKVKGDNAFLSMNYFRNHELSYTGFFMQDMFYRLTTGESSFYGKQYKDENYSIDPKIRFVSASIGYYIPQLRRFARSFY